MSEPSRLKRGKLFHKKIQSDWVKEAEGDIKLEKGITKPSGRKGRVDILVDPDCEMVAIAEVKTTDWDRMTDANVRRNAKRHIRQIWNYIESQLAEGKEVCPGFIFPKRPKSLNRMRLIESLFEEDGIPVVWDNESIKERKARSDDSKKNVI